MLSRDENELLTQIGPGTAMGQLMRQYWMPVLLSAELEHGGRVKRVRLLGEDLVALRARDGKVGLLGEHCSHRRASLYFGRNEEAGLRCIYHGWKYGLDGQCLEMPNESAESDFQEKVCHPAYPCAERGGVVWTYMGPAACASGTSRSPTCRSPPCRRPIPRPIQFDTPTSGSRWTTSPSSTGASRGIRRAR